MLDELKKMTFANEAEEAAWWETHEEALADEFEKAGQEGRLGHGTARKRALQSSITISLDPEDIAKAHEQSAARGLSNDIYLKTILHEALGKAEAGQEGVNS
jgi:predicted DNA binding CopG/RHH family protein